MPTTAPETAGLLEEICLIARQAGAVIMPYFEGEVTVRRKDDWSPVTEADEAAEMLIVEALAQITPDIPIVAEELVAAGETPKVSDGRFWLVDPLDGTKEFVNKIGQFSVNIALIEDKRPVMGVVYGPVRDELYAAAGPGTAFAEIKGVETRPMRARRAPPEGLVVLASRSHANMSRLEAYLRDKRVAKREQLGSSLKFCAVANGRADLYPRFGRTMEWDTAAGHAVLVAAGGHITTVSGDPFLYEKPGFENDEFLVWGLGAEPGAD